MQQSGTTRFLKGKSLPGLPAPVKEVVKFGDKRIAIDQQGNRLTLSKTKMRNAFNSVLAEHQRGMALKTIRELKDHRATVMIGGKQKGEKKVFASVQGAKAAVNRYYDKA